MPGYSIPPDAVIGYATTFRTRLRDLTAAYNHMAHAEQQLRSEASDWSKNGGLEVVGEVLNYADRAPTPKELLYEKLHGRSQREAEEDERLKPFRDAVTQALAERDSVQRELSTLAGMLLPAAVERGRKDTAALTAFQQTWSQSDLVRAADFISSLEAHAWLESRGDHLPAAVERSLHCVQNLRQTEQEWWREIMTPPPMPESITFGHDGRPTKEHLARADATLAKRAEAIALLAQRRDELRAEILQLAPSLTAVAVRPEIQLDPSPLRQLIAGWNIHAPSDPDLMQGAVNLLGNIALKLSTLAIVKSLARADSNTDAEHGPVQHHVPATANAARPLPNGHTSDVAVPDGFYSPTDIAKALNARNKAEAIRKALKRLFDEGRLPDAAWMENNNPAKGQATILYRLSAVRPLLLRFDQSRKR